MNAIAANYWQPFSPQPFFHKLCIKHGIVFWVLKMVVWFFINLQVRETKLICL